MSAIQSLKKQLRGVRSTQKITKAMKTISSVKFSKLNSMWNAYAEYGRQCQIIADSFSAELSKAICEALPGSPTALLVLTGNKGLCGSFNSQTLKKAEEIYTGDQFLIPCGKEAAAHFEARSIPFEEGFVFNDVPTFEKCGEALDKLLSMRREGRIGAIKAVYSKYVNMMTQTVTVCDLLPTKEKTEEKDVLFLPNKESFSENTAMTVLRARFYSLILENAIGAQAATLLAMRNAYDTSVDYCTEIEDEINRMRQSAITADVIETHTDNND